MNGLSLEHAIVMGLDRFLGSGEAVQPRPRIRRAPRDWRLVTALLIWAVLLLSMSHLMTLSHKDAAAKTQADSWLCKRQ
jgi:hypothetical protein